MISHHHMTGVIPHCRGTCYILWKLEYALLPFFPIKTGAMSPTRPESNPVTEAPAVDLALMDEVLARYRGRRGAIIPLLQAAQAIYGYLPRPVLEAIARATGTSLSRVYGVATFYAQFYLAPRGRHVLKLCDGTACHIKGTPTLVTALADHFAVAPGHTTADGRLTVEVVYCLGSCALAPVAVLDNRVMGRLRQDRLIAALKAHIQADEASRAEGV
jgi:NADH-quinone oxidoreductase subunit E